MIRFETGNILDSPAQCLVNTVNCEGFMGKGIAYQFKEKFPENNKNYVMACKSGAFTVGKILFFFENNKLIANFPTKDKWREKSQYSYIKSGLEKLKAGIIEKNLQSIAIPPLGCGNGGLDWNLVKKLLTEQLADLTIDIIIYEPSKIFTPKIEVQKMTASHLILMKLKSYIPSKQFNKMRLQKAAFFLNIFSNTDYFKFEEYKFGPYSHPIEILSQHIKAFQDTYHVTTNGAEEILYNNIISNSVKETVEKYKLSILKATSFINSIESDKELEIVATNIAIIYLHPTFTDDEIVNYFLNNWPKYCRERFSEDEIKLSLKRLLKSNIINQQLLGYNISQEIIENVQLMPKYKL